MYITHYTLLHNNEKRQSFSITSAGLKGCIGTMVNSFLTSTKQLLQYYSSFMFNRVRTRKRAETEKSDRLI